MRFQVGDRVLCCSFTFPAAEGDVVSVRDHWAKVRVVDEPDEEPIELELSEYDLYLLAPMRRPFLEDVERAVRLRFHRGAADAIRRYWIDQRRYGVTGREGISELTKLLRGHAEVRRQALADGDRSYDGIAPRLRSEITGPEVWRASYREWLQSEPTVARDDAAFKLMERCQDAAAKHGVHDKDL